MEAEAESESEEEEETKTDTGFSSVPATLAVPASSSHAMQQLEQWRLCREWNGSQQQPQNKHLRMWERTHMRLRLRLMRMRRSVGLSAELRPCCHARAGPSRRRSCRIWRSARRRMLRGWWRCGWCQRYWLRLEAQVQVQVQVRVRG